MFFVCYCWVLGLLFHVLPRIKKICTSTTTYKRFESFGVHKKLIYYIIFFVRVRSRFQFSLRMCLVWIRRFWCPLVIFFSLVFYCGFCMKNIMRNLIHSHRCEQEKLKKIQWFTQLHPHEFIERTGWIQ